MGCDGVVGDGAGSPVVPKVKSISIINGRADNGKVDADCNQAGAEIKLSDMRIINGRADNGKVHADCNQMGLVNNVVHVEESSKSSHGNNNNVQSTNRGSSSSSSKARNVALIAGVTGLVGNSLVEALAKSSSSSWKIYGVARRPRPDWLPRRASLQYLQCDLLDREETLRCLSRLNDVTHVFWVCWVARKTEEESCAANGAMLCNTLDALLMVAHGLKHICLQTGSRHYLGPMSFFRKVAHRSPPFVEDMCRLPFRNFYYTLEDIVIDAAKMKQGLTWSVHRPSVIFGFAPRNLVNLLGTLAVYATICKHDGLPFIFPGHSKSWECIADFSDADLVAEHEIWAAMNPQAKNTAFNATNGDFVTWKRLWYLIAEKFGLEVPPYTGEPTNVMELMKSKEHTWDSIVAKHSLYKTRLDEVGQWHVANNALNLPFQLLSSMNRSKEMGFQGFCNTEKSVGKWIDRMRERRIIP